MDWTMQMVYETEGKRGADIRGWHGREAQMWAENRERDLDEYEQAMRAQYEAAMLSLDSELKQEAK